MIAALLIYSVALLAFAGDYAFGRPRRKAAMLAATPAADRTAQLASVGAASAHTASAAVLDESAPGTSGPNPTAAGGGAAGPGLTAGSAARPVRPVGAFRAIAEAGP